MIMWMGFFDIGFTCGLKNKLAEAIALKDIDKGRRLISSTYYGMTVIFIPLCISLILLIPLFNWSILLNISSCYNEEIAITLQVVSLSFCLQMILNILIAIVSALQRGALGALFPVIGNFVTLIILFILTKTTEPSLVLLSIVFSFSQVLVLVVASIIMFKGSLRKLAPSINMIDSLLIKKMLSLGSRFFIIQIQVVIFFQSTNVLILYVSSPEDVTTYNISYKYLSVAMMLFSIVLTPVWSAFTDAYTQKDFVWMNRIYKKILYVFGASCVLLFAMICLSPIIYPIWIGTGTKIPFSMTIYVGIYLLIYLWVAMQLNMLNGMGVIKIQMYISILGLCAHVPLAISLGKLMGAMGVISSMIIITLIYALVYGIQMRKILSLKATGIWIK